MKFSAQEEYGLRCLVTLAKEGPDGFLTILEISRREGLSPSHVAKLLSILRRAGLVQSVRGQAGGYRLGRDPGRTSVSDVLAALGGRLYDEGFCGRHSGLAGECLHSGDCSVKPLWVRVQRAVDEALNGLTLKDLLGESGPQNVTLAPARGVEA